MIFGYLRISTTDKQDFERQLYLLNNSEYKISERNLFFDRVSGKSLENREQYQLLRKIVRAGDTIVFTELARFSRNYDQISTEMTYFQSVGVNLVFLDMPFLSNAENDLTQKLISDICVKLFSFVAQTERENISKRIKQKLSSMKSDGTKLGRPCIELNTEQVAVFEQYITHVPEQITAKQASQMAQLNINSFYKQLRLYRQKKS